VLWEAIYGLGVMGPVHEQLQQSASDVNLGKTEQPPGPEAEEDTWDEERIEQALKLSKEMHIQVGYSR
jgi:hypothetical protein